MVQIGTDHYWDGGLVSNTPLQHVLETADDGSVLVFQVDLFSARGLLPRDMYDVMARQKDIQYSSRTRLVTDYFRQRHAEALLLKGALAKLPQETLNEEERAAKARLDDLPEFTILQLIYQQSAYEGHAKDYEFSGTSMREHWNSGYRDTQRTLRHEDWLRMPRHDRGIIVHDIHRVDD
jgi:NTE family protein